MSVSDLHGRNVNVKKVPMFAGFQSLVQHAAAETKEARNVANRLMLMPDPGKGMGEILQHNLSALESITQALVVAANILLIGGSAPMEMHVIGEKPEGDKP